MKWFLLAAAAGVAYFVWKYPYAVGALVKYPSQRNEIAKTLNDASTIAGSVGDIISEGKAAWAAVEAKL